MHGAEDMVGNLSEWVALWAMEPGYSGPAATWTSVGAASYGNDFYTHGGSSSLGYATDGSNEVFTGATTEVLPAAAFRGGSWGAETSAGVFGVGVSMGPTNREEFYGFRCCLGR